MLGRPHDGPRPSHQKSTCLTQLNLGGLWGANVVTLCSKFRPKETRVLHRADDIKSNNNLCSFPESCLRDVWSTEFVTCVQAGGSEDRVVDRRSCPPQGPPETPPWRQLKGKSMVSYVNSRTNATRIGWYMWQIDSSFAP